MRRSSGQPGRVVLHVGAPKSGTTYLQSRLHRNAVALAAHGVLVPRADAADGPASLAFRAALDLTGVRLGRGRGYTDDWWDRLVAVVGDHVVTGGTAVVSDEAFVRADAAAVARAVADLRGTGATLDVVYTARDLARQLVSGWLEGLKHGGTRTFGAYLDAARDGELRPVRAYDVPGVLGPWVEALGDAGRVHLVTVPPEGGDRTLLWTRFLDVAGLDPAWAPEEAARSNDAVGLPEAQLLRALNERLGVAASRGGRLHGVVQDVVREGLTDRGSPRVRLDPRHASWVEERTSHWVAWARGSGVDVVGDLDDLRPAPVDPATWADPDRTVPAALDAADAALAAVRAARRRRP